MYGSGAHQLLGWLRETNWRENERAALLAAKASVEPNQVFEGRTLVSDWIVDAVDQDVRAVREPTRAT